MGRRSYTDQTLKRPFGLSGNECAMEGCSQELVLIEVQEVLGVIAHIKGLNPTSARYDPNMTDAERNDYPNLIVLCPTHASLIDINPGEWPVTRLEEMKRKHEDRRHEHALEGEALLLAMAMAAASVLPPPPAPEESIRDRVLRMEEVVARNGMEEEYLTSAISDRAFEERLRVAKQRAARHDTVVAVHPHWVDEACTPWCRAVLPDGTTLEPDRTVIEAQSRPDPDGS